MYHNTPSLSRTTAVARPAARQGGADAAELDVPLERSDFQLTATAQVDDHRRALHGAVRVPARASSNRTSSSSTLKASPRSTAPRSAKTAASVGRIQARDSAAPPPARVTPSEAHHLVARPFAADQRRRVRRGTPQTCARNSSSDSFAAPSTGGAPAVRAARRHASHRCTASARARNHFEPDERSARRVASRPPGRQPDRQLLGQPPD